MKILIAPDSFKESATALEVAQAIKSGFSRELPHAEYILMPLADGGEGTVDAIVDLFQGKRLKVEVTAPLGNKVQATYGYVPEQQLAIIEMAEASGLVLVPKDLRNPLNTSSYGTGELIKHALDQGATRLIIGIGGSATNDMGVGMLQALGAKFLDHQGKQISLGAKGLRDLKTVDYSELDSRLTNLQIEIACDVTNPLCGANGSSAVFGPQKGATPQMVLELDQLLNQACTLVEKYTGKQIQELPGSGAAGGMGAGLCSLPHAELKPGFKIISDLLQLDKITSEVDLVITGEGRMDSQSIQGKTPTGIAKIAKSHQKPVIALVGSHLPGYELVYEHGIDAVFPIISGVADLETTLKQGKHNLENTARNIARILKLGLLVSAK